MTTKTPAQHLEILKAHNAWRRGATRKLEVSPKEIGEAIDCAIGAMEAQANCTRSHPHELMSPACELRTQLAKTNNENAHLQAERDALKADLVRHDAALRAMICDYTTPEAALEQVRYTAQCHADQCSAFHARIVKLSGKSDALTAELKALREQKPVAWITPGRYGSLLSFPKKHKPEDWNYEMGDWYCSPLYAQAVPADPLNNPRLQQLFGDAIEGALGFGFLGNNKPPEGHWLQRFWNIGRAEAEKISATVLENQFAAIGRLFINGEPARAEMPTGLLQRCKNSAEQQDTDKAGGT